MEEKDIPDGNIFMICDSVNKDAYKNIPKNFYIRKLRPSELNLWMEFPFDNEEDKQKYKEFMKNYFNLVYLNKKEIFFNSCLVICDQDDNPVSTCFAWKAYDKFWTIHWFKTLKKYEGLGLGRAILTQVMKSIPKNEYPVYLHTQPSSYRAIKIYSDFGFKILVDKKIGDIDNDYKKSLKILKIFMKDYYNSLKFEKSDGSFSDEVDKSKIHEF